MSGLGAGPGPEPCGVRVPRPGIKEGGLVRWFWRKTVPRGVRIETGLACGCTIEEKALNFTGYGECPLHGRQRVRWTQAEG